MSQTVLEPVLTESSAQGAWMVVIYNNDSTEVNAVLDILMVATGCDLQEALTEVWEAEHFGKASVHFDNQTKCEEVAQVISSIGVKATVEPEWQP